MIRLRRFLAVAFRQCFLAIAIPSRASLSIPLRYSTVNKRSRLRLALSKTRPKSAAFKSLLERLNRYRLSITSSVPDDVVLRRQASAAFGTTAFQHETAGFGGHARAETVCTGTLQIAGLKCAFHCL